MRGSDDLLKAIFAFRYFNQYTAWFPIRIKILPTPEGTWAADMLVRVAWFQRGSLLTRYSLQIMTKTLV
jgi:hypothetical protein